MLTLHLLTLAVVSFRSVFLSDHPGKILWWKTIFRAPAEVKALKLHADAAAIITVPSTSTKRDTTAEEALRNCFTECNAELGQIQEDILGCPLERH